MSEWNEVKMGNSKLVMHMGSKRINWDELGGIITPAATKSWVPVPHTSVVEQVVETLGRTNLMVKETAYCTFAKGQRFFGLLGLDVKGGDGSYQLVVGLRNSHDQSFPVGMVVGSRVFVCDNLAFSSEIQVTRRHTKNLMEDLPRLIVTACSHIGQTAEIQEKRFAHYKNVELTDVQVHDLLVQSLDIQVIGSTVLPKVLGQWRAPAHAEFATHHNVWRLWNGFTEVWKGYTPEHLPARSLALQGLLDVYTQFTAA